MRILTKLYIPHLKRHCDNFQYAVKIAELVLVYLQFKGTEINLDLFPPFWNLVPVCLLSRSFSILKCLWWDICPFIFCQGGMKRILHLILSSNTIFTFQFRLFHNRLQESPLSKQFAIQFACSLSAFVSFYKS